MQNTPRLAPSRSLATFSLGVALFLPSLHSATLYQTVDQAGGGTGTNWTEAIWGPGPAAATAGNDYISENMTLRTSNNSGATLFPGDSLTMINSTLIFRRASSANFILDNAVFNAVANSAIGGTMLLAEGKVADFNTNGRTPTLTATLSGGGAFTKSGSGTLMVDNADNTFHGTWIVAANTLTSATAGSFDTTGLFDVTGGTLDINYNFDGSGTALVLSGTGKFDLTGGFNHTFASLTIAGTSLSSGTYSFADLDTDQQAYFTDGGDTFTVAPIPEPSTYALLLGGGALALAAQRRGKRSTAPRS